MANLNHSRRNRPDVYIASEEMKFVVLSLSAEYAKLRKDKGESKIKESDRPAYFRHLNNIVTDLYCASWSDPDVYIGYSRGKHNFLRGGCYWDFTRGEALLSYRIYLTLVDFLAEQGYIENHIAKSGRNPHSSRMRAKPKLLEHLQAKGLNWASIRVDTSKSAIVVKDENKAIVPPPADANFDLEQAEANLRRINEDLQSSFINLSVTDKEYEVLRRRMRIGDDDAQEPDELNGQSETLDFTNRTLKRIFNQGSFDCAGRFYGGWWQGVPSQYRKFIEIEGRFTVDSTIQPRILYAKAEAEPPDDAYAVPGWDAKHRRLIKKAFNQLVNSSKGSRPEGQWHRFAPDIEPDPIPEGWAEMKRHQRARWQREEFEKRTGRKYGELLRDLKAAHKPIDQFFFSQAWTWLQRRDSDIAEKVMLKLIGQGYTALPIHDSFIVIADAEGRLREAMNEAFEEVVGVAAKVDLEATVYDGAKGQGLVDLTGLFEAAREDAIIRSKYHRREVEWQKVWGPL
jgi:hypothetical protein